MSVKEIRAFAQSKMKDVIESLAKHAGEGDVASARLLAELAGSIVKSGPGRPSGKAPPEEEELTADEIKKRTAEANEILKEYGDKDIQGP